MLRARIAITSDCNLRCSYCFIDKERGERMSRSAARAVLDELISSPGPLKVIGIYGGEPMTRWPLLEEMILRARFLEKERGKTVRLSVATNGLLLDAASLGFFRRERVHLCISLDGRFHDRYRRHGDGRGSARQAERGAALAASILPPEQLTALQGVHPQAVSGMAADFSRLLSLGFRNVNFEMIQGPAWTRSARSLFSRRFARVRARVEGSIRDGVPAFLQPVNRMLFHSISGSEDRPALQVHPSGRFSDMPYPFAHAEARFRAESLGSILELRQRAASALARRLLLLGGRRGAFADYLRQAADLGCSQ